MSRGPGWIALTAALLQACARGAAVASGAAAAPPETFAVQITTSQGDFVIEAHRSWAPRGADRFFELVRAGYFDDSRFFRVREGYIAQFGIAGDSRLARAWQESRIPDDSVREHNIRGAVAFAMTGPDTRTTQLYINLKDNAALDSQGFAPIGRVVTGMDAVDRLYAGYGENAGGGMRGGKQGPIFEGGKRYLDSAFPRLDRLIRARIMRGR